MAKIIERASIDVEIQFVINESEARALDAMAEADAAYEQEQWEAKQANPLTSECPEYQGVHPLTLCRIPSKCAEDDDIPF
jgi:hypothetical protein